MKREEVLAWRTAESVRGSIATVTSSAPYMAGRNVEVARLLIILVRRLWR
jgi:hypothetical protein